MLVNKDLASHQFHGAAVTDGHVLLSLMLSTATYIQKNATTGEKMTALTLSPELPQHGVPRPGAPGHNIICKFFTKFPSRYFVFTGINQRPERRYFGLMGICNGRRS